MCTYMVLYTKFAILNCIVNYTLKPKHDENTDLFIYVLMESV